MANRTSVSYGFRLSVLPLLDRPWLRAIMRNARSTRGSSPKAWKRQALEVSTWLARLPFCSGAQLAAAATCAGPPVCEPLPRETEYYAAATFMEMLVATVV